MNISPVKNKQRAAEILLVDDNFGDTLLAKKAFKGLTVSCSITVAENGEKAMDFLRSKRRYDMILLDLNLPGMSGIDILREVKSDKKLWCIPVIVLTTSRASSDVTACYDLLANSYVVKPLGYAEFKDFIECLSKFWFEYAISPYA